MTTNKSKLVNWDADFYKSLSDDFCLYCLSKKQVYVIGQALQQVHWGTRWYGDTGGLDFSAIAGELEGKFGMDECGDLSVLQLNIISILQQLADLRETVDNGGVDPNPEPTVNTPYYQYPNQQDSVGGVTVACDTTQERDALYGGIHELVEYMINSITDMIELMRNAGTALPEKIDGIISAIPILETLPFDEVFGFITYLAEEVEEIWDATVTEDRKQALKCEIFCGVIANNCTLTPELIVTVLALKAPQTLKQIAGSSIRDILAIIVAGTPVGDELFYSLIGTMVLIVLAGEQWLNARGWRPFEYRFLAGYNSPDNDWSIFCTNCPTYYYTLDYHFDEGEQGWEIETWGSFQDGMFVGEEIDPDPDNESVWRLDMSLTLPQTMIVRAVGFDVEERIIDCGTPGISWKIFNNDVEIGGDSQVPSASGANFYHSLGVGNPITGNEVYVYIQSHKCDGNPATIKLRGIRVWLMPTSETKGILSLQAPPTTDTSDFVYWKNWKVGL